MRLPKALIKKYGISKKAWSVFRGRKTKTISKSTKVVRTMARRGFRRKAKRSFRSSSSGVSAMKVGASAAVYGAVRDKIHSYIPNTGIPYSDSVVSAALAYFFLYKKSGWMKNAGVAIIAVEAAAVGQAMTSGMMSTSSGNSLVTAGNQDY